MLLSHSALGADKTHGRKHKEPPPDEVYYADACADHYQIPRALVHAVITVESGWNPNAVSDKNARGLMQLMPRTAARYGVSDAFSKLENTCGGVHYLADLIHEFGDFREAVAAYYCGERHVEARRLEYANPAVTTYVRAIRNAYAQELKKEGFYDDEVASR
jgi:soluble lytic murein transglycosylase-like protein